MYFNKGKKCKECQKKFKKGKYCSKCNFVIFVMIFSSF
jgi:hypothetical protein